VRPDMFVTCLYVVSAVLPEILGYWIARGLGWLPMRWEATWLFDISLASGDQPAWAD